MKILPPLDSPEQAEKNRAALDVSKEHAGMLGRTAEEFCEAGSYRNPAGETIDLRDAIASACDRTVSLRPEADLPDPPHHSPRETTVQVTNETTLEAAFRRLREGGNPVALNFANGIEPGGGFLVGARAQEEVLCRSSALYRTLVGDPMYEAHRERPLPDSTDWAIYSPDVPVFRSDDGTALASPRLLSFITCAAPYAPRVGQAESAALLEKRIHRVLAIAQAFGHEEMVLGAWGCGAFGNDPGRMARDFRAALENRFEGAFSHVVFAITDWSPERRFLGPFVEVFSPDR